MILCFSRLLKSYSVISILILCLPLVNLSVCKSTSHHTEDDNELTATAIPSTSTTTSADQVQTDFRGNLINPTTEYYHDHQPTVRQSSSDDYEDNDESMWLDLGAYSGDHGSYGWYVDHPVGD